jgi:hypothetical protein
MELSQEDQAQILAVLNRHLDSLALSTKLSKIAQVL